MHQILSKIFRARHQSLQGALAAGGLLVGLLMLLLATQLYLQINRIFYSKDNFSDYLIVSKKIALTNTLFMARADFSEEEITDLKSQSFVKEVAFFKSNQYAAWLYGSESIPIQTELFFEALPDQMLGEVPNDWRWQEGDDQVPIIVSQEFLNLYNFGYALAKGLPQISKSALKLAPSFNVRIYGAQGSKIFKMRVIDLNERVPSILVPESFMDWANKNIGANRAEPPARLMLHVNNPSDPALQSYMEQKDWQVNQERLKASRAGGILQVLMSVLGLIGLLFISLSVAMFVMQFRVLIAESKEEIRLLLQLGYTPTMISRYLLGRFAALLGVIAVLAAALTGVSIFFLGSFLEESGLESSLWPEPLVIVLGLAFMALVAFINVWSLQKALAAQKS